VKAIDITPDCPPDIVALFQKEYRRVDTAIKKGDMSEAQMPRVGIEAAIELHTRRDVMQWVLEMLNACEGL
jgi:hypothetical protein